jgi:uncharacterized protein
MIFAASVAWAAAASVALLTVPLWRTGDGPDSRPGSSSPVTAEQSSEGHELDGGEGVFKDRMETALLADAVHRLSLLLHSDPTASAKVLAEACAESSEERAAAGGPAPSPGGTFTLRPRALRMQGACDAGSDDACVSLAHMYRDGSYAAGNEQAARALLREACRAGLPNACGELGAMFAEGEGGPRNLTSAIRLLNEGCEREKAECWALGRALLQPGKTYDPVKATVALKKGCSGRSAPSCATLAELFLNGTGVEKNVTEGMAWLEAACELGQSESCSQLAGFLSEGKGVERDQARAKLLYAKACALGLYADCSR